MALMASGPTGRKVPDRLDSSKLLAPLGRDSGNAPRSFLSAPRWATVEGRRLLLWAILIHSILQTEPLLLPGPKGRQCFHRGCPMRLSHLLTDKTVCLNSHLSVPLFLVHPVPHRVSLRVPHSLQAARSYGPCCVLIPIF